MSKSVWIAFLIAPLVAAYFAPVPAAWQPTADQRIAALEAEVVKLRNEIKERPIWTEDRFRSSVIELLDGQQWRVTEHGLVERVR